MAMVARVVAIIVSILQVVVTLGLGYYYLLLAASVRRRRSTPAAGGGPRSFAIAIPAHNEMAVLGETIESLRRQNYPPELFDVFVAADHCDDATAEVARGSGAICHERREGPGGRKAYAVRWLLERILECGRPYDGIVVFDADSRVHADFLSAMNRALCPEHPVQQGRHVIANAQESVYSGLADVDMRLNNLLRNQARQSLGLSCRLMGDAMCFATEVIREHGWPADSLTEDREYGLYLLTRGIRVRYVPEALSFGQAAPGWSAASRQRLRWTAGAFGIQRKYAPAMLRLGLTTGNWATLDQAVELLLPPLSALALLGAGLALVHGLWRGLHPLFPLSASVGLALGWVLFPFLALWADRAPAAAYRALLYAPGYLLWRIWLGLRARVTGRRVPWSRTTRREEIGAPAPRRAP